MSAGLTLFDIGAGRIFEYADPSAADTTAPLGPSPSAATFEPVRFRAVVSSDVSMAQYVLDLNAATFASTGDTFRAPSWMRSTEQAIVGDLIAIPDSDLVVGLTRDARLVVTDAARPGPQFVVATLPESPIGGGGTGAGLAVLSGNIVLASRDGSWIAQVDMAQLSALATTPNDLDPDEMDLSDAQVGGVMTFIGTEPSTP